MQKALNFVDICFVIDTTGSMGSVIDAAKRELIKTIFTLSKESNINIKFGMVEYRDHPPQETSFITHVYPLTDSLNSMQEHIKKLQASGGGDAPEAVYDGVATACTEMRWRDHSCRFVLLVGDAPPHGFKLNSSQTDRKEDNLNYGDTWPEGCPCGLNVQDVTAFAESYGVIVHALAMSNSRLTEASFREIANFTGGQCTQVHNADKVIENIRNLLTKEFANLELDEKVLNLATVSTDFTANDIATALKCSSLQAAAAIARLGRRGFLYDLMPLT